MEQLTCYHCGNEVDRHQEVLFANKSFCCNGCKTVYEIFSDNNLTCYYDFQNSPGATPSQIKGKYDYLDQPEIASKLLEFENETHAVVSLYIPHVHCSSCIWILEHLNHLNSAISNSQINFHQKKVRIVFDQTKLSLKNLVLLLHSIGYEPYISLENYENVKKEVDRSLIYKVGVAFFCFGNIMLLSFPDYFGVDDYWFNEYKDFFRWLIFIIALPTFFYSASGYYISAWKSLKAGYFNIDVPMALGIIVMFIRSTIDIVFGYGQGFFDSMASLIFFMLCGKLFQQKTYEFLSFERDYKSYFPIAVTKLENIEEIATQVYEIKKGDRLLIRNEELLPVDAILISPIATIDYSFVTGEAIPVSKLSGDKLFAGGKLMGATMEVEVINEIEQSYLTQLWSNDVFQKDFKAPHRSISSVVSQYFTPILLGIAFVSLIVWLFIDTAQAFNVFTSILIVACPCALALTVPFTLGNVLRQMGNQKLYLKNAAVIEQMSKIDTIVFDKTGTITSGQKTKISSQGSMGENELGMLKLALRGSNHPLSRQLYSHIQTEILGELTFYEEITGKGIVAVVNGHTFKIGSDKFLDEANQTSSLQTKVHVIIDGQPRMVFLFENHYRENLQSLLMELSKSYEIQILSGDNEGEREYLNSIVPTSTKMYFNQKPDQKLMHIRQLQESGKKVMMVGDGLNDAGALAQSDVGIVVSENVNVFSPACDGILSAVHFHKLDKFMGYSNQSLNTIYWSFGFSFLYNIIGLSFACSGNLSPLVAAIIMPISTFSIISFVTIKSNFYANKHFK